MDNRPSTSPNGRPVAVVTGTSSGMGLHTAVALARRGHTVVATMRDTGRDAALRQAAADAGAEVEVRPLDVTDHDAARTCVEGILADHGRIDVLVNNAGRGAVATAEQLSLDEVREQLEVNYLGPVALTKLVLPHMREARSGRVLTVTSVGGAVGQPFADAYCGAKFAVEGFMQSLAVVMLAHGVRVSVVEPAAVASDFVVNVARPDVPSDGPNGPDPYAAQLDAYLARSAGAFANAQSSRDAAVAIADAATSEDYRFRWQTSEGATAFVGMSLADTDGSRVLGTTRSWIQAAK
ncbi:SDR family oxidoreductase [Terrabacter terrae]|uniref:SDR family oxidoreductase n=1 Tax=Terrabacter terrae TaxID=318434 RepID=A0ABN2U4Y3_9MICO